MKEMEMPIPCVNCNEIFDLNDGYGSEKWHPNTVICEDCHKEEEEEIEEDERWESINTELSNALYELEKEENLWLKLDEDNKNSLEKIFELKPPTQP